MEYITTTLSSIGVIAIIALALYMLFIRLKNQESKAEAIRKLITESGDSFEYEKFWRIHPELSDKQSLLKFYDSEKKITEAIKRAEERKQSNNFYEDLSKKGKIIKRVFAYQYEKFIFSVFSPLAQKKESKDNAEKWECTGYLPEKYLLRKIKEEYNLTDEDAMSLLVQFANNDLIHSFSENNTDKSIKIGHILDLYHNVVCDSDLNIDKYIKEFGQRCTYEELRAEIENSNYSMH